MAERLNPETHKKTAKLQEDQIRKMQERDASNQAKDERSIKNVFNSIQWYYPVHKYIGDIVKC